MFERLCNEWNFRRLEERRTLLRWLDAQPGERVLDVGYGYNDRAIAAAGARVVGIDVDPRRVSFARTGRDSAFRSRAAVRRC